MVSLSSTMSISFSSNSAVVGLRPPPPMWPPSAVRFLRTPFTAKNHLLRLCSATSANPSIPESSGSDGSSVEKQGSNGKDDNSQAASPNETLARLKRYGVSGILSYGLLNTGYYLTTFLVVWVATAHLLPWFFSLGLSDRFYVAPAPGRMGYLAAVERFLKVMAMVWAGSQVTKLMRAGGALALAPFVDRGLSWFTIKFGFESQGKAFGVIAGLCFGLAFLMFVIVTLLWA